MPRPLFRIAPRLLAAVLFFVAALSRVVPTDLPRQQRQACFSYQAEQLPLALQVRRCRPNNPIFFADAFSVPTHSHAARHAGTLQPVSIFCDNGNIPRNSHRSLSDVSAANACAAELRLLGKQNIRTLRASVPPPARLQKSAPPAAPTSGFESRDITLRAVKDLPTAVSTGAGGLLSSPSESAAAPEWPPAPGEPSPVSLSALSNALVTGEQATRADAVLHAAVAEAETPDSGKSTTTAAATAREAESEKAPAATPLGPVVTRKDLLASLTAELQLPRADVERTVAALLRHITANLEVGRKISISKFGTFNVRRRKERVARNPRTGEALNVAAATFPTLSFSKVLKERVRDVIPILGDEENEEEAEERNEEPLQSNKKSKQLLPWP